MNTATITDLTLARDGVILVHADCARCQRSVLHGAGDNLDDLVLGHRLSHCGCPDGYELVDPNDVVRFRGRVLRRELAEREERRAASRARRLAHHIDPAHSTDGATATGTHHV